MRLGGRVLASHAPSREFHPKRGRRGWVEKGNEGKGRVTANRACTAHSTGQQRLLKLQPVHGGLVLRPIEGENISIGYIDGVVSSRHRLNRRKNR